MIGKGMAYLRTAAASANGNRIAALVAAIIAFVLFSSAPVRAQRLQFTPTDFLILSPDGQQKIGYCTFRLEKTPFGAKLHGASRYITGETDFETVTLAVPNLGEPRAVEFEHSFFDASGKATLLAKANFTTGEAHCADYRPDSLYNETQVMTFPPDTWAGAAVAIPVQRRLRIGDTTTSQLHFFTCAPGPKIYEVDIAPDSARSRWPLYRGDLVRVDVRPDFGIFDLLVKAFVPHLQAWFDPSSSWDFVGAQMARYYKGPPIIMVKAPGAVHQRASESPPAIAGAPTAKQD
jgi:hypothetical protein